MLSAATRARILDRQARCDARFGEILLTNRLAGRQQLYAALSQQYDAPLIDLTVIPPDPGRVAAIGADGCLRFALVPLRRFDGTLFVATARPEEFERHRAWLTDMFGPVRMATGDRAAMALCTSDSAARLTGEIQ